MIRFHCGHCLQSLKAHPESAARPAVCPSCGRALTVPEFSSRFDEAGQLVLPPGGSAPAIPSGRRPVLNALPVESEDHAAQEPTPRPTERGVQFPGRVICTFGGNRSWAVLAGIVGVLCLGFTMMFVTLTVLGLTGCLEMKDPTGLGCAGVLFGGLALGCGILAARSWGASAVITEDGLGIAYPFTTPVFDLWDEIRAVYENNQHHMSDSTKNHRLRIETFSGSTRWLHRYYFAEIIALGEAIQQEMSRLCLHRLRADLRDGEMVRFGPVRLDDRGLDYQGDLYRWRELGGIGISEDYLCVVGLQRGDVWCKVPLHEVPNPRILEQLVEEHLDWLEGTPRRGGK